MRSIQVLPELAHRFWNQLHTQGPIMTAWAGVDWVHRAVTGRPVRRFSEITPRIFIGGQPGHRFFNTLIKDWQVTGIINMRSEYDYEVKLKGRMLNYLNLPTDDNEAPSLQHLMQGVDFIRDEIRDNGKVYIHCWEGLGRGPTMAAAYFVSMGLSPDEAWAQIRAKRPFIRPTAIQNIQLERFAENYEPHLVDEPVVVEA